MVEQTPAAVTEE